MIVENLSPPSPQNLPNTNINHSTPSFPSGSWERAIDVRGFIQSNYLPYLGDGDFLPPATDRTIALWNKVKDLMEIEREKGVLDVDNAVPSGITSHAPGYIDRSLEQIVGLQTDQPLKRAILPLGGIRTVESALKAYGYELDPTTKEIRPPAKVLFSYLMIA